MNTISTGGVSLEITVLRCACFHPEDHVGEVCPKARIEPHGPVTENQIPRVLQFIKRRK